MRFDSLTQPVSDAEPCGPDLDELGDDDYLNYMLGADNRMPTRFLDAETNAPVDRSGIDIKAEVKAIAGFLEQSRDLRLLTLEARFQALVGNVEAFCECVQAIAALARERWEDVHPKGYDDDYTLRQNTIAGLDERTTIVLPLQYAPILRDQRVGALSLRDLQVATGKAQAREDERVIDLNQILDTLRSDTHRTALDGLHASLKAARSGIATIRNMFDERTDYTYTPSLELVDGVVGDLLLFIENGRPDLGPGDPSALEAETTPDGSAGAEGGEPGVAAASRTATTPAGAIAIPDAAAAANALLAAELYFGRFEPSSPALILIHQARLLVGKPLVRALEALLPDNVDYASMVIDSTVGFNLGIAKLREITDDYAASAEEPGVPTEETPTYEAPTRPEAMRLLAAVSAYFRSAEPSSPIPMLIGRAERFVTQNFQAILTDLMPKPSS